MARWGGVWTDYQAIHQFLDWPREHLADGRSRRVLHNSWGIALAVQAFGLVVTRSSDQVSLDVQLLAEQHILGELPSIPTLEASLEGITLQRWMCARARPLRAIAEKGAPA